MQRVHDSKVVSCSSASSTARLTHMVGVLSRMEILQVQVQCGLMSPDFNAP